MVCFCFNSLAMFSLWSTSRSSLRVGQDEFEEFEEPDWAWSSVDGNFFLFRIMSNWKTWKKNEVYATSYAWLCELFKVMCSFAVVLLKSSVFTYISPILALPVPRRHQRLVHPKQNSGRRLGWCWLGWWRSGHLTPDDIWRYSIDAISWSFIASCAGLYRYVHECMSLCVTMHIHWCSCWACQRKAAKSETWLLRCAMKMRTKYCMTLHM